MADTTNKLPEGTDTVIDTGGNGRSTTGIAGAGTTSATGGRTSATSSDTQTDALITRDTGDSDSETGSSGGIRGMVGTVTGKAKDEALGRARGFVGEGLKSSSNTLGSIAGIIEDTVEQIGERLGPQYGDYARSASQTIQRYASTLENKDPDELVDDARSLIRKSPAVAITGAAILGFGLIRLIKAGLPEEDSNGTGNRQGNRASTTR
ncbi:hypothetical protein [Sphingomonas humi]|uniref:CsbD-like domain-containing protein n=1 Tax=Sphingomonas humi TaxID=335630 RepID=A0ABP7S709_9SPHN